MLIQLLKDAPVCDHYEFTGEAVQEPCAGGGSVGAAILGWERSTAQGDEQVLLALRFADHGRLLGEPGPGFVRAHVEAYFWRRIGGRTFHGSLLAPDFPSGAARPDAFRQFRFVVSPQQIEMYLDGVLLKKLQRDQIMPEARRLLRYEPDGSGGAPAPAIPKQVDKFNRGAREFQLREALAIFTKDGGARFRSLQITPRANNP